MRAQELEPELEALLLRLVPDLAEQWQGASAQEIDRIEAFAGRPLPRLYRWFLMRMGSSMGPLQYRSLDFSAAKVLSCYEQGLIRRDPRLFMIGYETDEIMPLHLFYDFDHPARDDARVTLMHATGGAHHAQFDTFREMLAWGELSTSRIGKLPQVCSGSLRGESGAVLSQLDAVISPLGFTKPIPTGMNCGLYERADAGLSVSATPRDPPDHLHFFDFGAADAGTIRRVLGVVANESALEVSIKSWTPPLPDPGMNVGALEPETEDLLLRLVPGLADAWQGASAQEIDRIEALAGRPLPRFYRWFLLRMGRSMGPLQFRSLDCSASTVLSCYAEGAFDAHPRYLMIGYQTDDMMPLSLHYDFDHPARDDARVANLTPSGSTQLFPYETLREKLALGEFLVSRIETLPQICRGTFKSASGGVLGQLDPLMARAGFTKPIPTGPNCGLYERADASLAVSDAQMSIAAASPYPAAAEQSFDLGGADAGTLQRILASIVHQSAHQPAGQSALEVTIKDWTPPLPAPATVP